MTSALGDEAGKGGDSFWDELAKRLDDSFDDVGTGGTSEASADGGDLALMRTRSGRIQQVCELGVAFLMGTHARVGKDSPIQILLQAGLPG
eukprot:CAMPEP_0181328622 /NCGR_PEP_ID=MMETSP1101-20121128/22831_1 /TAXON_ID=46948 /ORGANISM="Rhodomonas abbreviata, Strain Caron Lab Isolate" /LENGTH=90 /DNA_ID=CAMNT_0023437557 /DNA_START=239 /DNA_END=507 /DNA_ORIENTATION=-